MGVWLCHMQASKNKERTEKYKAYQVILVIRGIAPISGGILFTNSRCIHKKYTVILFPRDRKIALELEQRATGCGMHLELVIYLSKLT